GRYHFYKFTQAGWSNAIQYYDQALQVDPGFALAYCGKADTYAWMWGQTLSGREAYLKEKELAEKALALDPNLAEAHISMGVVLFCALNLDASEKELNRALELNSNRPLSSEQKEWTLMVSGRFDESSPKQRKAWDWV